MNDIQSSSTQDRKNEESFCRFEAVYGGAVDDVDGAAVLDGCCSRLFVRFALLSKVLNGISPFVLDIVSWHPPVRSHKAALHHVDYFSFATYIH